MHIKNFPFSHAIRHLSIMVIIWLLKSSYLAGPTWWDKEPIEWFLMKMILVMFTKAHFKEMLETQNKTAYCRCEAIFRGKWQD